MKNGWHTHDEVDKIIKVKKLYPEKDNYSFLNVDYKKI